MKTDRQERIQALIDGIKMAPIAFINMSSDLIEDALIQMQLASLDEFDERAEEAAFLRTGMIAQVQSMLEGKKASEELARQQEAARLESERIARVSAEAK